MLLHLNVIAIGVMESLGKTEIDNSDLVQRSVVVWKLSSVANNNVVKLEIVVEEPRLVDHLDGVQQLNSNL